MPNCIAFMVPAMSVDIMTRVGKRRVAKTNAVGQVLSTAKLIPKERPRFTKQGHAFTSGRSSAFEAWIRKCFFKTYPGSIGVLWNGRGWPLHSEFVGCQKRGAENISCTDYRNKNEFVACKNCVHRRKNLRLDLDVYLADDRHLDLDNLIKITLDALNRVCFYDDGQFVEKHAYLYHHTTEQMRVSITQVEPHVVNLADGLVWVGGYPIWKMPVTEAEAHARYLIDIIANTHGIAKDRVFDYLMRCDGRAYINKIRNGK